MSATWPGSSWALSHDQILYARRQAVRSRLSIYQRPGSERPQDLRSVVREQDGRAQARGFPPGRSNTRIVYNTTPFIRESVNEVFNTLRDAVILVAVVVLLFLQNWRSAVIPLIAVPVAIVGTFAVAGARVGLRPQ